MDSHPDFVVRKLGHPVSYRPIKYTAYGGKDNPEIARRALMNGGLYEGDLVAIASHQDSDERTYGLVLGKAEGIHDDRCVKILYNHSVGIFGLRFIQFVNGVRVVEVPGHLNNYHNKRNDGKA